MISPTNTGLLIGAVIVIVYAPVATWMIIQGRRWDRKAKIKRRLLVNEDGQFVWRTVRGRCLVGGSDKKQQISWGRWADDTDWAIIETAKRKLVVYRFDKRVDDQPRTGVIQICDSWRALELAVPPTIFEDALLQAGIKKPDEYRELPLEL